MTSTYYPMPLSLSADSLSLPSDLQPPPLTSSPQSSMPNLVSPNLGSFAGSNPQAQQLSQQQQLQKQQQPQRSVPGGSGGGNRKGTSAERRATHNAIERARRESLNGRFLQLAASLPAIADVRRPSKSLIVNKSLDFVHESLSREAMYRHRLDSLRSENDTLREQLNEFRRQAGLEALPAPSFEELPRPLSEMGDKKRSSSLSGTIASIGDLADLDEDDGLHAGSSEGENARTSPISAPAGHIATDRHSLLQSMPSYNNLQESQMAQHQKMMDLHGGLGQTRASSTAPTHSEDYGAAVQGSWDYAAAAAVAAASNGIADPSFGADMAFTSASNLLVGGGMGGGGSGVGMGGGGAGGAGQPSSNAGFLHFGSDGQQVSLAAAAPSVESMAPTTAISLGAFSTLRNQQQAYGQYLSAYDPAQSNHPLQASLSHTFSHHLHHALHPHQQQQHPPSAEQQQPSFMTAA